MSKYLPELIRIAREDIPSLIHDLPNASTPLSLKSACEKMLGIMVLMLHDQILDAVAPVSIARRAPAPTPIVIAPVAPTATARPEGIIDLPVPPTLAPLTPVVSPAGALGMPEANVQPGVTNVFVTTGGTKVVSPTGATAMVGPGEPVNASLISGRPVLPDAEPGVAQVILPPGGGMTPEFEAALAGRGGEGI